MSATIGALRVNLGLDSANFSTGLGKGQKQINAFAKNTDRSARQVGSAFATMGGAAKAASLTMAGIATAALAPILSVGAALRGAKTALAEFDKIGKAAKAGGLDAEAYQAYAYAAELGGVATDEFSKALETFAKNSGLAVEGKGRMVSALKALNPELLKNLQTATSQDQRLRLVADALQKETDATRKAAIAAAAFGDAGIRMVEMLKGGSAALDETARRARQLGIIVDRDLIANAETLNDEFSTATKVIDLQFKQALINLAPVLVGIAERAARLAGDIRTVIDSMKELENRSSKTLSGNARNNDRERLQIENRILELREEQRKASGFAAEAERGVIDGQINILEKRLADLSAKGAQIEGILGTRRPDLPPLPTGQDIGEVGSGGGGRNRAASAAIREAEAVKELIGQLQFERQQIGLTDLQKKTNEALRQAGAAATAAERQQIALLIAEIDKETTALEANAQAQESRAAAIDNLFQMGFDSLMSIADGSAKAEDALKALALQLARSALQAALFGSGPMGSLFGGGLFRASGGPVKAARGGKISGPGGPKSDRIPAMLSNGEFVVNAAATRKFGALLEAINFGGLNLANGGYALPSGTRGDDMTIKRTFA